MYGISFTFIRCFRCTICASHCRRLRHYIAWTMSSFGCICNDISDSAAPRRRTRWSSHFHARCPCCTPRRRTRWSFHVHARGPCCTHLHTSDGSRHQLCFSDLRLVDDLLRVEYGADSLVDAAFNGMSVHSILFYYFVFFMLIFFTQAVEIQPRHQLGVARACINEDALQFSQERIYV